MSKRNTDSSSQPPNKKPRLALLSGIDDLLQQASSVLKKPSPATKPKFELPKAQPAIMAPFTIESVLSDSKKSKRVSKHRQFQLYEPGTVSTQIQEKRREILTLKALSVGAELVGADPESIESIHVKNYLENITSSGGVEWWDRPFIKNYDEIFVNNAEITHENLDIFCNLFSILNPPLPPEIKANDFKISDQNLNERYTTPKERRQIRKKYRQEKAEQLQKLILLGLADPEKQKLKLNNRMVIESAQSIQNPTSAALATLANIQERKLIHDKDNAARQLSREDRKEKRLEKIRRDAFEADSVVCALFRVGNFSKMSHRTKVGCKARDLMLSGTGVSIEGPKMTENICFIYVEGGPKGVRLFSKLLMQKIDWNTSDDVIDTCHEQNWIEIVWQGNIAKRRFRKYFNVKFTDPFKAREFFNANNAAVVFDTAKNFSRNKEVY
ncbi:hypothetical protein RCL1_007835 [Eukaryota sp. TZLM3-RCL]